MIAVFEVETTDGETYLVHCQRELSETEFRAAAANLRNQAGIRNVHLIGMYQRIMECTVDEITNDRLFVSTGAIGLARRRQQSSRIKTYPVQRGDGRVVRVTVPPKEDE